MRDSVYEMSADVNGNLVVGNKKQPPTPILARKAPFNLTSTSQTFSQNTKSKLDNQAPIMDTWVMPTILAPFSMDMPYAEQVSTAGSKAEQRREISGP